MKKRYTERELKAVDVLIFLSYVVAAIGFLLLIGVALAVASGAVVLSNIRLFAIAELAFSVGSVLCYACGRILEKIYYG